MILLGNIREQWAAMCLADGVDVWSIAEDKDNDIHLFLTKRKPDDEPIARAPMWQVWEGESRRCATPIMQEAYRIYNRLASKIEYNYVTE